MKKYLMTGIAAVAMCAAFTSCSHDVEPVTQEQLNQLEAEKAYQQYESAFIAAFGQPAANQTWGFSGAAFTRTENANANEWADPDKEYGGLKVPPPLTDKQIALVKKYFQTVKNPTYQDPHWTNYFIQQVYKGGDDPINTKEGYTGNASDGKPYSSEKYIAADQQTKIVGSNHMDHLAAIFENGNVDHINNFNHGTCSENYDVLDNGQHVGGSKHTDRIMYMKESTTYSFGYYNSNGSLRHTEYTGLVSWETIRTWARQEGIYTEDILNDSWNRSFMGFDFEQMVGDDIYAKIGWGDNANDWAYYTYNNQQYHYLNSNMNMYCGDLREYNDLNGVDIAGLLSDGYLPVQNSADKKWVKVGGCADGYYSDWIVTLTKAEQNIEIPKKTSLRVMAEDLSAKESSDFDFNDVVFDVIANEGGQSATIILRAAGGTLPLRINGKDEWEVHKLFGVATNVMVNTGAAAKGLTGDDNKGPVTVTTNFEGDFSAEKFCETVGKIKIEVYKNKQWMELYAQEGKACCKFGCDPDNKWVPELENIDDYYNFKDWVQGFTATLTAKITW